MIKRERIQSDFPMMSRPQHLANSCMAISSRKRCRTPKATFTSRSLLQLGVPSGFIDANDKVAEQRDHFFKFFKEYRRTYLKGLTLQSTPSNPHRQLDSDDGDLNVKWMSVLLFNKDAGATAN